MLKTLYLYKTDLFECQWNLLLIDIINLLSIWLIFQEQIKL